MRRQAETILDQDYAAEFRIELTLLVAQALDIGTGVAAAKACSLYAGPMRVAAASVGQHMDLPPRAAASFLVVAECARFRSSLSRWPKWVVYLRRRRWRDHDRLSGLAATVMAEYRESEIPGQYLELLAKSLNALSGAPGPLGRARASP